MKSAIDTGSHRQNNGSRNGSKGGVNGLNGSSLHRRNGAAHKRDSRGKRPSRNGKRELVQTATEVARERALLAEVEKNPLRLFPVADIRCLFHVPEKAMRRLRRLAQTDPLSDPWSGDLTSPEQFSIWYWGPRRRLELAGASR